MTTTATASACYHGGAFFEAIGAGFDDLSRRDSIISADVLDAWFPPAPGVLDAMRSHLDWMARTSPPTQCEGLQRAIAVARGVEPESILCGAGSSALIFLALREWLTPASRVLLLDPTYGEYAHVLRHVVGCRVERVHLDPVSDWRVDPGTLAERLREPFDLVIIVNPNNPTGQWLSRESLQHLVEAAHPRTQFWIDEAYLEYVSPGESLEQWASTRDDVVVCKTMSKVYALSGLRAAYLCGSRERIERLRALTPPWAVSLPAQVAAVRALEDEAYYAQRWHDTGVRRLELSRALASLPLVRRVTGAANWALCHLDPSGPSAQELVARCRAEDVFLRDARNMGSRMGSHLLRSAVRDRGDNARIVEVLARVMG